MNNTSIAIKTTNLTRRFGNRIAVDSLNIEIRQGEIFSLLGTNGAGKTTTIKMLCCLLRPTSGDAVLNNMSIHGHPENIKKIIGVSPQETAIAGHLTAKENLLLMGGVSGLNGAESNTRARNLMDLLEIEDRRDQTRKLSGGLQRRLSIAMALMSDPQIIFFDEPTLGLDPHARRSVWNYIEKLKKTTTILLTTHYLEEADALSDTIAIMDKGKIIETGTSEALKSRYTDKQMLKIMAEDIPAETVNQFKEQGMEVNMLPSGIELTSSSLDFYSIITVLHEQNIKINGIHMQEPTLDDVFLYLTRKEENV